MTMRMGAGSVDFGRRLSYKVAHSRQVNGGCPVHVRGHVLQATWRARHGRPVVHVFGRLESGQTFLARDRRARPGFFVERSAVGAARRAGAQVVRSDFRSMRGVPLARVEVALPADVGPLLVRLRADGVVTYEADVGFATRFLIDHGVRGGIAIDGQPRPGTELGIGVDLVFDDADIGPAHAGVALTCVAFDIETDPDAAQVLAIALHADGLSEVLLCDAAAAGGEAAGPDAAGVDAATGTGAVRHFTGEAALLRAFAARIRALDADVLTGWNVVDFDLAVLARRARALRVPFELGRMDGALRLRPARGFFGRSGAQVPGRVVLDGIALLQGAFVRMEDYSLDAVAASVLGEGKALPADRKAQRAHVILRMYHEDRAAFVHYARTDARLAYQIVQRLRLVDLAVERSRLTGMPPDRVAASIASFDYLYLSALKARRIAAPDVRAAGGGEHAPQAGGHVLEPVPGLHADVLVFDFRSLYPSIIRTFGLDPLAFVQDGAGDGVAAAGAGVTGQGGTAAEAVAPDDFVVAPNGARFRRGDTILGRLLDDLFARRERARGDGDAIAAQAIKILMNSFYGVLGTPACRFHNPAIANAITAFGKLFLTWAQRWFERRGLRVLYGDTDSLFVAGACGAAGAHGGSVTGGDTAGTGEGAAAAGLSAATGAAPVAPARDQAVVGVPGPALAAELNAALARLVARRWRVHSRLELRFEKHYLRLFLPSMRLRAGGARKRYVGLLATPRGAELDFVGMEAVRRDWTPLARRVQRELYARLFDGRPVEAWLRDVVAAVRAGRHDDELTYRKGLRKALAAYERTTPPHVLAARRLAEPPGRTIEYVVTVAGPEPVAALGHAPDREHYVQKQVRPVVRPVLAALGLDFDAVVGDLRQMSLF
jgi:DNA polymerase-2